MRFMFTLQHTAKTCLKSLVKQLLNKAYRLCLYQENKSRSGEECNQHYHGTIEMDGNRSISENRDQLRYILDKHITEKKAHKCIKSISEEDEKAAMSYCSKQGNAVALHNISYDPDELQEWWKARKKELEVITSKKAKLMKEKICSQFMVEEIRPNLQELKVWVARYLIDQDLLPVMSKVRSYTMYIVHKCGLKYFLVEELDKLL